MSLLARLFPRTAATFDGVRQAFPDEAVWSAVDVVVGYIDQLPGLSEVAATVRADLRDASRAEPDAAPADEAPRAPAAPVMRRRRGRFIARKRATEKSGVRGVG